MSTKGRQRTEYVGVYYYMVNVRGGKRMDSAGNPIPPKQERCYLVTFARRGEKQKEETLGRASEGWTAARANTERGLFTGGKLTKREEKALREREAAANKLAQTEKLDKLTATVSQVFEKYSTLHSTECAPQDKSRFKLYIKPYLALKAVSELTQGDLLLLKKAIEPKIKAPQSLKHVLTLLRRVINWGEENGFCVTTHKLKYPIPSFANQVRHEVFHEEELAVLILKLEEAENDIPVGSTFLQCAIYTGLRPKQIRYIRWKDVHFRENTITVRRKSKIQGETVEIPMNERVRALFERIPKLDDYVFPSSRGGLLTDYRYQINQALASVTLPDDFRPVYSLRHNFASWFARLDGTDIHMLMHLLTHTDIRTTQRYSHLFAEDKLKESNKVASVMGSTRETLKNLPEGAKSAGRIGLIDVEEEKKKDRRHLGIKKAKQKQDAKNKQQIKRKAKESVQ